MEWKKCYVAHSSRVKSLDIHPVHPWIVTGLYVGHIAIYEYTSHQLIHKIEVCNSPIRSVKFVPERDWVVCGNDEGMIYIYNALTQERIHTLDAHGDYVRHLAVHPTLPLMLSCADDMEIHCWNLKTLTRVATFVGHQDYVMQVNWSPRSESVNGLFASCSLDGTIRFWSIPQSVMAVVVAENTGDDRSPGTKSYLPVETITNPNFTLTGHEKGVNSIYFSTSIDKPYIISSSDDFTVKIWDYQSRQCLQTLYGHESNVSHAIFHPSLPIILTCCEAGVVKIWNNSTYKCTQTHPLDMGRLWLIGATTNAAMNDIAIASDEGLYVASLGRNKPLMSLYSSGRLVMVKGNDFQSINLKQVDPSLFIEGKRLTVQPKDMGSSSDILYPHSIQYSPNGRYLGVLGSSEQYSILTSQALRVKHYGVGHHFTWLLPNLGLPANSIANSVASFATAYCTNYNCEIDICDDEGVVLSKFVPSEQVTGLFGNGPLLGVAHDQGIHLYHPQSTRFICHVKAQEPVGCYWELPASTAGSAENAEFLCAIVTPARVLIYKYRPSVLATAIAVNLPESDEGLPEAFTLVDGWVQKNVTSGLWIGKAFFYCTEQGKMFVYTLGNRFEYCNVPGPQFLLGYLPFVNRIITTDRDCKLTSFGVDPEYIELLWVLDKRHTTEEKTVVDDGTLEQHMNKLQPESRDRIIPILTSLGLQTLALKYATSSDCRYKIALEIEDVETAAQILQEEELMGRSATSLRPMWSEVGKIAAEIGNIPMAVSAFKLAQDLPSLAMLAMSLSDADLMRYVLETSKKGNMHNVAYMAGVMLRDHDASIETFIEEKKFAEAALYARTYKVSRVQELAETWDENTKGGVNTVSSWANLANCIDVSNILNEVLGMYKGRNYPEYEDLCGYDFLDEFSNLGKEEVSERGGGHFISVCRCVETGR